MTTRMDEKEVDRIDLSMRGREGVAIILVLGLVSVLMISAVAFAISMRIERQGSFQYRYGVQAKHMLWVGLSEAIKDIDGIMAGALYPEWDMRCSTNGGLGTANVLTHSVTNFFSGEQCTNMLALALGPNAPYWHTITVPSPTGGQPLQVGRYAFIIVNQSGLLDANKVAGLTRAGGTNTQEIQVTKLTEINNAAIFAADRTNRHIRYESTAELAKIASNRGLKPGAWPVNMAAYSLSPDREVVRNGVVTTLPKCYIGGTKAQVQAKEVDIKAAFTASGVSDVNQAFISLLDYVDDDDIPEKLDAGCGEAVPMINEFELVYNLNVNTNTGSYTYDYELHAEYFYPFDNIAKDTFKTKVSCTFAAEADNTHAAFVPSTPLSIDDTVQSTPNGYYVTMSDNQTGSGNITAGQVPTIHFKAEVKADVHLAGGGQIVDSSPYPIGGPGLKLDIYLAAADLPNATDVNLKDWIECVDPRFNWSIDPGGPQWYSGTILAGSIAGMSSSIGAENKEMMYLFTDAAEAGIVCKGNLDGDRNLHVGNSPVKTIGELGNLCIGPWRSIRIYDHKFSSLYGTDPAYHKVLDYFTASTNSYRRGLVNVNTTNAYVLASLFYGVPTTEYAPGTTPFTEDPSGWVNCMNVANAIISYGPYTNLSDVGRNEIARTWTNLTGCSTEIGKEGPLRNSADFLTVRDNQFAIVVAADAFSAESFGGKGSALASARAIAEIWRDPFKDQNGRHRVLIRQFRMMGE